MQSAPVRKWTWLVAEWPVYLLLATVAMVLAANVELEKHSAMHRAFSDQADRSLAETRQVAARVERYFDQIYRGLRTIARLPSVRTIDRHAENFHAFARGSVQEIYNNLAETAKVSEVYILPIDFNPEAIVPRSGKLQEPIAMFDEFIIGRSADPKPHEKHLGPEGAALEEIEIHEYLLMRQQIGLLKSKFASASAIEGLAYPIVMGPEVITCDNSLFSASHRDNAARMGIVLSMPFYDLDGNMRGIVSAVVLTATIGQLLPSQHYSIVNEHYHLSITRPSGNAPERAGAAAAELRENTALESTGNLPLMLRDVTVGWTLATFTTQAAMSANSDVKVAKDKAYHRHLAILIALLAMVSVARVSAQRHREVQAQNALLERRVLERTEALETAKKSAETASMAKSQFLAHMSHEIRTPMSAVIGTVDLLLHSATDAHLVRHLDVIRNSGQALVGLINQMLDLAAVEAGRVALTPTMHPVRLLALDVANLFEPQAKAKGLRILTSVLPSVPEMIWVDAGCCRQVLINLVANAIKATDVGRVEITIDLVVTDDKVGRFLRFDVSDTGSGISDARGKSIFDLKGPGSELHSLHKEGAGLGLPISRLLVEKMGGTIGFGPRPEGGSCFFFTLPLQAAGAGTSQEGEWAAPAAGIKRRPGQNLGGTQVLLVEDNPTLAKLTREILETVGCEVVAMADGLAAVAELEHTAFDVILMDCRLQGLDGIEATRLIRAYERAQDARHIAIIGVTANAFDWDREACIKAGMNDFVSKPFTADQLFEAIARTLGSTPAASGQKAFGMARVGGGQTDNEVSFGSK